MLASPPAPATHCAIYTRKSTDLGLERPFNSLESQREVCSAYIASQQHKGWLETPTRYDDAAQSGGTIDRPALQQLLRDVERGLIKVIVIYKIDRLSRSLADFARLIELFDRYDVSFVSVTQSFDTSESMGRLVLNILLTFAQFEREMLADRVRDKLGAMRRRGKYVGGRPPYGYDVVDGRLVINPVEAAKVRAIFRRFIELGSYQKVQRELRAEGMLSKAWTTRGGEARGATLVSAGMIYSMLHNPLYIGKVQYQGEIHEGEHEAVLSEVLWDAASALRSGNTKDRQRAARSPHLLSSLLFDSYGRRMVMHIECYRGQRYRYYTSEDANWAAREKLRRFRAAANELEDLVLAAIKDVLGDRPKLRSALLSLGRHGPEVERLPPRGPALASYLEAASLERRRDLLVALIARGEIAPASVTLVLRCAELERALAWDGKGLFRDNRAAWSPHDQTVLIELPVSVLRYQQARITLPESADPATLRKVKPDLVRLVREARRAQALVETQREMPSAELGRGFKWKPDFFARVLRLNYLAPDIIAAILDGTQPEGLTRRKLIRTHLPLDWALQRQLLGFPARAARSDGFATGH